MMKRKCHIGCLPNSMGISLLEALFALIIIAVMMLASVTYFRQAEHQSQIAAFLSEMKGVIQAAEDYNNENGNFKDINATDIARAHYIVPRYNVVITNNGTNYLVNPWTGLSPSGSEMAGITVSHVSGSDTAHMKVTISQLPSFACEQVLDQLNQFMDILGKGDTHVKQFCIEANTKDKLTTLGTPYILSYPKSR